MSAEPALAARCRRAARCRAKTHCRSPPRVLENQHPPASASLTAGTDMADRPYPLIFDAHLDLAWNAIDWNRDLKQPVAEIRRREVEACVQGKGRGENTVSFPDLRRGRVGLFIATLLARLHRPGMMPAFS